MPRCPISGWEARKRAFCSVREAIFSLTNYVCNTLFVFICYAPWKFQMDTKNAGLQSPFNHGNFGYLLYVELQGVKCSTLAWLSPMVYSHQQYEFAGSIRNLVSRQNTFWPVCLDFMSWYHQADILCRNDFVMIPKTSLKSVILIECSSSNDRSRKLRCFLEVAGGWHVYWGSICLSWPEIHPFQVICRQIDDWWNYWQERW